MKEKIYVAPSANRKVGYPNRYFILLKEKLSEHYEVLEADNRPRYAQGLALLVNSFKADVFLVSFIENIAFHKLAFIQYLMALCAIYMMRLRGKKIIYIFHNPHPHQGENWMSRSLTLHTARLACHVISHSKDTCAYARGYFAGHGINAAKVEYICHPIVDARFDGQRQNPEYDALIWGAISPYKGIGEFIHNAKVREAGLRVHIVGRCKNPGLLDYINKGIETPCATKFTFENRPADFDELPELIADSRHVLFPYIKGSISGSGVLMDTISMGGDSIGPNVGAFADLAADGVCKVYDSDEEMLSLLQSPERISHEALQEFISENSWNSFIEKIVNL